MNKKLIKKVLIVSYYGKFPEWMNIWLRSCELNTEFDFMIVTDVNLERLPRNVKIINYSMEEFRKKLSKAAGFEVVLETPYKLCDYKPLYGKALEEYLTDYDFWGHCDIDLVWGNLSHFITEEILDNYDLIGMYGHLMMYRNNEYMNNLFKLNGGTFTYREVYSNAENYSFDEMSGMDLISRENGVKHYKDLKVANVSPNYERFKIANMKSEQEYFVWSHGRILRIYGSDAQFSEEYAYLHFSGKKPKNQASVNGVENANLYLHATVISDREIDLPTKEELLEHNEYISDIYDTEILKKTKKQKIKKILDKSIKQKLIWVKVHKGITKFMNAEDNK